MSLAALKDLVSDDFLMVNQAIKDACASDVALISHISEHLIDSGGKRLRPLFSLLCGRALSNQANAKIATFAAVIEFIHAATLLHDDVVDESSLRRGQTTANQQWGNQAAVLVGDFLYSRAFQMMVSLDNMAIMRLMADTTNTIAAGEVMQLVDCHDYKVTESQYFAVIHAKTAVLFSAACHGVALVLRQPEPIVEGLAAFGLYSGIAYQLVDDALDYTGDAKTLGKHQGDDFAEGKLTLPLIYALSQADATSQAWLAQVLQHTPQADDFRRIQALIDSTGAITYTYQLAEDYRKKAADALAVLGESTYRDALQDCLGFITARRY